MLHEKMLTDVTANRRKSGRVPFPAELVIAWIHDPDVQLRLAVIDASDGGYRIRSAMPMLEGTIGVATRLLPEGQPLNQTITVVWSQPSEDGVGHQVGLRIMSTTVD